MIWISSEGLLVKNITISVFLLAVGILPSSSFAVADCYGPKLARDAIRAIALISNRSMITDMVGGCPDTCDISANYRHHGYSDRYEVVVDEKECRVISLKLTGAHLPIQSGDAQLR